MSLGDFKRILTIIPRTVRLLNLWHRGEPLCAPEFPEMIEAATKRGLWTQTYSNGTLLGKGDIAKRLVKAQLKRITLSVDGATEESYQEYRVGGKLASVLEGMALLYEERKRAKSRYPKIIVECLLRRHIVDQIPEVKRLAKQFGADEVKFKTYRISNLQDIETALAELPSDPALWRYDLIDGQLKMRRKYNRCRRLYYSAVIANNGEVFPCCFYTKKVGFGNILKTFSYDTETMRSNYNSWSEIVKGPLREFRNIAHSDRRDEIPMCRNCTEGLKQLYIDI